jgi:signal peptidase
VGVLASVVVGLLLAASLAVLGAGLFGYRFLVVETGSMGPTIPAGAVVMATARPTAELAAGDVMVFTPPRYTSPVVHRVVQVHRVGARVTVVTQGDANNAADAWGKVRLRGGQVHVVVASVPLAGGVAAWLWTGVVQGWLWAGVVAWFGAEWVWRQRRRSARRAGEAA